MEIQGTADNDLLDEAEHEHYDLVKPMRESLTNRRRDIIAERDVLLITTLLSVGVITYVDPPVRSRSGEQDHDQRPGFKSR